MQKIYFNNSRGGRLVGRLYDATTDAVIVFAHGFTGDKSEWGRFDHAADALHKIGYRVLTFDFSGCGESDNDSLTVEKQVDDFECAKKYLHENLFYPPVKRFGVLGLSLGALVACYAYNRYVWADRDIYAMVLWSPVTKTLSNPRSRYSHEQLQELDSAGRITFTRDKGLRKKFIVDKKMLEERIKVDQEKILRRIRNPLLIIHGDADERVPYTDSVEALQFLKENSMLSLIRGADHKCSNSVYLSKFIELTLNWFKAQMPIHK